MKYLIVVDVQKDFIDGALGTAEAQTMLPALLEKVRSFDGKVIFTKDTHTSNYLSSQEGKNLPVPHCICPSDGWKMPFELELFAAEHDCRIYEKNGFGSPELARDIRTLYDAGEIESAEFAGLCTDICVVTNALLVKGEVPELPLLVDARCCAGVTPAKHEAALEVLASCQVKVLR